MMYRGLFKRIIAFFLTFAAGLFIASFFVTIATPNFNFRRGSNKYREVQRLRTENQELKRTNCELRKQMEELGRNSSEVSVDYVMGEPVFPVDAPPPPPKAPRHPRFER